MSSPSSNAAVRKAELRAELRAARTQLSHHLKESVHQLNVVEHLRHSITEHRVGWFTGAAMTGGLLSWALRRSKKGEPSKRAVKAHAQLPPMQSFPLPFGQKGSLGLILALLGYLFNFFKPVLNKLLTQKIEQLAKRYS